MMNPDDNKPCGRQHNPERKTKARGPSSAWLHDPVTVLDKAGLKPGQAVLDLGCGAGDYALAAAAVVGPEGKVWAVDKRRDSIDKLSEIAASSGLTNVTAMEGDIWCPLELESSSSDRVLLITVLHIFKLADIGPVLFPELYRILKSGGQLVVVDCKKEDATFGPPLHMRQAPQEIEGAIVPYGFVKTGYSDLGYNYLIQFTRK